MGLWIAENSYTRSTTVGGTAVLDDRNSTSHVEAAVTDAAAGLKRNKDGLVLVPQPSDDPRDPLNWPTWKRELCYCNILFATGLVGAIGPLIAPGFVTIARELDVSVNEVAKTNAALVLAIGCVMFFQSAIAIKYGRRPVYIWGAVFLLVGSIWSAAKPDIKNLLASRIIQGMGMAPTESIATATIGDLYFVHQRGLRIAIWGLCLLGGINCGPLVNGYVITNLGWEFAFWIITPFLALSLILMIFFLPETMYDRPEVLETDSGAGAKEAAAFEEQNEKGSVEQVEHAGGQREFTQYLPAKTFWEEVKPWSGYINKEPLWRIFIRPFPLLFSPAVMWGFLTYGIASLLLVLVSAISSLVFSRSYGFNASQTGLVSLSPLIASILMSLVAGYIADALAKFCARRNGGIFEPEMRLFLMIPYAVLVVAGYGGWAASYKNKDPWIAPVMCYAAINGEFLSTASVTYILDVHRHQTSEAQAIINFLKNLISYFIGSKINGWVISVGIETMFYILAGISAGIALTTIVMYRYGKVCRSWVQRHEKLFLIR